MQFDNGLGSMFALGILGSMFNGGGFGSPLPSADFLKQKLEEDENKEEKQVFNIPAK